MMINRKIQNKEHKV